MCPSRLRLSPPQDHKEATATLLAHSLLTSIPMAMCAATSTTAAAPIAQLRFHEARLHGLRGLREGTARMGRPGVSSFPSTSSSSSLHCLRSNRASKRKTLMCAVDDYAEDSLQKTMGIDRLINMMRDASPKELDKFVVENILSFNEDFWIRLAARTETCKSEDDKKDYEELATTVMSLVDRVVNKTNEKIESSTDILKAIVKPAVPDIEEIIWPPKDPTSLVHMEKELHMREQEGHLDEGFLSEVNAQLRQAKEDGDKPGLEAMLQKVLQLYASKVLSKRSYALKGGEVLKDEYLLESLIKAPSEEWNRMLLEGLVLGKGDVSPDELYAVIKKRKERILMRTEGGSYQQRILGEYLKGIQSRTEEIVQVLEGKQTGDANLGVPKSTDS